MLTRRPVSDGQRELYRALYNAGDEGLSALDLAAAMKMTKSQFAGVLGAIGRRINRTEGLEERGGKLIIFDVSIASNGEWHYRMRQILRDALEAEDLV